jgi:hypothetical protein
LLGRAEEDASGMFSNPCYLRADLNLLD